MRTGGRKGRRTAVMVQIAADRIIDLFALAEREAGGHEPELADRYVQLARRIGMRYNVRLLPEYADLYCRGCSRYWLEGRTVRTRLRRGHRVRTCLSCGRRRRVAYRRRARSSAGPAATQRPTAQPEVAALGPVVPNPTEPERGREPGER